MNSTRRQFLKLLSAFPFVGAIVPQGEQEAIPRVVNVKPDASWQAPPKVWELSGTFADGAILSAIVFDDTKERVMREMDCHARGAQRFLALQGIAISTRPITARRIEQGA